MSAAEEAFERVFWQALDDLKEGSEKPIESYLQLVPRGQRDELGRMLADVLLARGPAPAPGAPESEGYRRAVAVVDEILGERGATGILPGTLKAMRNARGIEPDAVVEQLAADFDVQGEEGRRALARSYHRLETGKLLGSKLSRRLLAALASAFDVDAAEVAAAARPAAQGPALKSAPAMGRSGGTRAPAPSRPSPAKPPDPEVELVERLFHGGPDA
ncbi:MAG TPA: hypothetical protein VNM41_03590 [Solirubrobacterales bacterium]|nr:hypothetical protein [Solirubrobacterales bacterium]